MRTGQQLITQAYTELIYQEPFWAFMLLRLKRVEDPTCYLMWTDGVSIGYNPDGVAKIPYKEVLGVLVHEVQHVVGLHPWRRDSRDPKGWNWAADEVVNASVAAAGFALPSTGIPGVPDSYVEERYREWEKNGRKGPGGGGMGPGEVRDAPATSPAERDAQIQEVQIAVGQALELARQAGKVPAGMEQYVKASQPQVPWQEVIAQFVDGITKNDYNLAMPNRRYLHTGLFLPSLHTPGIGQVVVAGDMSGSMHSVTKDVCGEILGIMTAYEEKGQEPELTVLWFDGDVYPQVVTDETELKPRGGGGTLFQPVMKWVQEEAAEAKALIMITDGYAFDTYEDPGIPVLWILSAPNPKFTPAFGEITCILNT